METRKKLGVIASLFLSISLSVSGQTDRKIEYVFAGKVDTINLLKKGRVWTDTIHPTSPGALESYALIMEKNAFSVVCTIEKSFLGNYQGDTIRFIKYDEFDKPDVSYYDHALFLLEMMENGQYVLSAFQYYDIYQTIEGDWIIPYPSAGAWGKDYFQMTKRKVVLKDTEYIDMEYIRTKSVWRTDYFLSNYAVEGEKAIPTYGASVDAFVNYLLISKNIIIPH
jgi:hypothetical protein